MGGAGAAGEQLRLGGKGGCTRWVVRGRDLFGLAADANGCAAALGIVSLIVTMRTFW